MNSAEHEKLFDDICSKLKDLSRQNQSEEDALPNQVDRLQTQIRRFQTDLEDTQQEMRDKLKALEGVQIGQQGDLHLQLKQLTEQINSERASNNKLNADLAKSLEVGLQLQLEIQSSKARSQQAQNEDRKFSLSLQEKLRQVSHELELSRALREEVETELGKARARYLSDQEAWEKQRLSLEERARLQLSEKEGLLHANEELLSGLKLKEEEIGQLNGEMETLSKSFEEVENSSKNHQEMMKNLTEVAENKIVELKMALDRKSAEARDYEGHLQQALTQNQLLRHENSNLKDYIAKINVYLNQTSSSTSAAALPASNPAV